MQHDEIGKLLKAGQDGQTVTLCGWAKTCRVSKNVAFIALNDGSTLQNMQVVVDQEALLSIAHQVNTGDALLILGTLKASPKSEQQWEVIATSLTLSGKAHSDYPLQKKRHSLEFLREIAHLRMRTNTFQAVFRVRNTLSFAIHKFFQEQGFVWAHTPIITGSDAEGAGELMQVTTLDVLSKTPPKEGYAADFFGRAAYLTVSGQLHGECLAHSHGKIYTFGPTFRAENSHTTRHLAEFWMVEPEMAFFDLTENMGLAESFLKYLTQEVLTQCGPELKFFAEFYQLDLSRLENIVRSKFARVSYTEAVEILQKSGEKFEYPVEWGCDLQTEHERYLAEKVFSGPTFVYNYPKDRKAFYMRVNEDGKTVAAMDLLVPGVGEIMGGSQREERLDVLEARMAEHHVSMTELDWYLDLRRFGTVEHSGFGLGFERLVMYLTGMQNIRDVIMFPRYPQSIKY